MKVAPFSYPVGNQVEFIWAGREGFRFKPFKKKKDESKSCRIFVMGFHIRFFAHFWRGLVA